MANEGGYSAGSIFLQVVPSFQGFEKEARRVAKGMEGVIEDGLDKGSEKGSAKAAEHVKDALTGPQAKQTAKDGGKLSAEEFSGEFEKIVKKRIASALSAIGKNAGEQGHLIRRELESLKDKKIGVDVDASKALATLADVELRARILGSIDPDIDISTNAAKVAAEMAAMNKELAKLDGKKAHVSVDADTAKATRQLSTFNKLIGRTGSQAEDTANSFRAFNGVILTTATLGPALIPILAGIAGGMLALGPAAAAAVAGVGALGIGFSGLGDAIGALNDVQKNAAKDTQASGKKMRNAADGIADAERSLARASRDAKQSRADAAKRVASAEEDAARSVESALGRQEDAEKSLADAQKDATKAQQDLRQARLDAQKDLEDIADKQRKNRVDERQAVVDLFKATTEYNAVRDDGGSTNLEKEESAIALENARIRLKDIRDEQVELNAERKKGVAGSDKVKTAEENVANAIERQKEAQESLRDAIKEVRNTQVQAARDVADAIESQKRAGVDAAESVADAQRALTRAQEDYRDALYETNTLGSESAQKLKQAMDALGPAGQRFARFIFGLKDEFYEIRNAVQAGLFPGLQSAIQTLITTYLPSFTAFMGELGSLFGDIAKLTAETLTNDIWKQFFSVFRDISPDLIRNYSIVFLNLATVMAQLATIAGPFAVQFSKGLVDLSAAAVGFLDSAKGQELLLHFIEEVKRLGPTVVKFFEALVPALFKLAEALLPLGELVLQALTGILNWIASMSPETLQAIVLGILTLVIAFQAAAAASILFTAATAALATPLGVIVAIIVAVIGVLVYLYTTNETARKIINAALKGIADAVQFYINEIAIPAWRLFIQIVRWAMVGIQWAWENILKPVFTAIAAAATWLWREILSPIFNAFWTLFSHMASGIKWVWENVLWPVFKVLGKIVWELYQLAFRVVVQRIQTVWSFLGDHISKVWNNVLKPVFRFLAKALGIDIDSGKVVKGGIIGAFTSAVGIIGKVWDTLGEMAKKPVKFIIETVFNNGLIAGFNFLASKLGMDQVAPIPVPKFANGGIDSSYGVRPGYTPGRDTHLIAVGGGEAILRPELTRALGSNWVHAANARAKTGGVNGAYRFLQGFKEGGVFDPDRGSGRSGGIGDWDVTSYKGKRFNYRTIRMLQAAERLAGQVIRITQGSYSTSVAASGSTHAGGGAFDAGWPGGGLGAQLVRALRIVGFAAWHRDPSQGPWNDHIHGIAAGDPTASASAKRQVQDYYRGGDGLGGRDDGPNVKKDPSLLDKLKGGITGLAGWVTDALGDPLAWLKSKVEAPLNKLKENFGDNWLTQGLAKLPEKFFGSLVEKLTGFLPGMDSSAPVGDVQKMVQKLAADRFGWSGGQWNALSWLVNKESSWNPNAQNPSSSAFGLFQFLDGTWGPYGPKTSDPALQAQYGLQYIRDRYGDPAHAKAFHEGHNWYADGGVVPGGAAGSLPDNGTMMYDNGGYLPPGLTTVVNLTGKPEPVFTAQQFEGMRNGSGSGFTYAPHFNASDLTANDVMDDFAYQFRRLTRGS